MEYGIRNAKHVSRGNKAVSVSCVAARLRHGKGLGELRQKTLYVVNEDKYTRYVIGEPGCFRELRGRLIRQGHNVEKR